MLTVLVLVLGIVGCGMALLGASEAGGAAAETVSSSNADVDAAWAPERGEIARQAVCCV